MRLNKFLAAHTSLSRRAADTAIKDGRVEINGVLARLGDTVLPADTVTLDKAAISTAVNTRTILLNKPTGYVCSRAGQGSKTIYDLLPPELHRLNPAGRLDKDSSGLLLMTDDGNLANRLTHPSFGKTKIYLVTLDRKLSKPDAAKLRTGVDIGDDYPSKLGVKLHGEGYKENLNPQPSALSPIYEVRMSEGRNRQIRRSFTALGYTVTRLHRTRFGPYALDNLKSGQYRDVEA